MSGCYPYRKLSTTSRSWVRFGHDHSGNRLGLVREEDAISKRCPSARRSTSTYSCRHDYYGRWLVSVWMDRTKSSPMDGSHYWYSNPRIWSCCHPYLDADVLSRRFSCSCRFRICCRLNIELGCWCRRASGRTSSVQSIELGMGKLFAWIHSLCISTNTTVVDEAR